MKFFRSSLTPATLAIAATLVTPAYAVEMDTAVINFSGKIISDGTCYIDTKEMTVILPDVKASSLKQSGATAGDTTVSVPVVCAQPVSTVIPWATLDGGGNVDSVTGYLKNTAVDGPQDVELMLIGTSLDNGGTFSTPINLNLANPGATPSRLGVAGNGLVPVFYSGSSAETGFLQFHVSYYAKVGGATPGNVTSSVNLTMYYQ
jgi:type 1 fimbria pilin